MACSAGGNIGGCRGVKCGGWRQHGGGGVAAALNVAFNVGVTGIVAYVIVMA